MFRPMGFISSKEEGEEEENSEEKEGEEAGEQMKWEGKRGNNKLSQFPTRGEPFGRRKLRILCRLPQSHGSPF